jgi:two-component system, NtrC family, response regulator AtoC
MVRLRTALEQAAIGTAPLLLRGESGTGKTLAARVLFALEPQPCDVIRLRCRTVSPNGVDAEFDRLMEPRARPAPIGLLLDDVGDAPIWLQDRVLSVVNSLGNLGAPRIVSATTRDLERLSSQGALGPEFLSLTRGTTLWLPPLRVRRADVREIVQHFLLQFPGTSFDAEALAWLEAQAWPENVRQLRDAVRRLVLLHDRVTRAHIVQEFGRPRSSKDG